MASLDPIFGMGRRNDADATRVLKDLVRRRFGLGEADSVFVAEVACGETDCPDVESHCRGGPERPRGSLRATRGGNDLNLRASRSGEDDNDDYEQD
jgi:hypothetical protein